MVKYFYKYLPFFLILFLSISIQAQSHLIADVQLNKNSVYVGEPVEVRVSIFTSTWFTSGIDPGNIKVSDAFTVYFRSLSTSRQINKKTYAGVVLYYNVFPYENSDITFPSLEFTVETPDVGGFKGIKRVVKTPERTIKVKDVPTGFNKNEWLVTSYMTISDNWLGNKNEVKVGDVLERKITRNASGTVSELVPPIRWDTIANVSLYPTRSDVKSNKTKTSISATRTDGVKYLFEKEGDIVFPEKVLTWWNPTAKKLYKRTLKGHTIRVLPNPDLGMLETMRDSLNLATPINPEEIALEEPKMILGLSMKQFFIGLGIFIVLLYVLIKISKRIYKKLKIKQEAYKMSEAYFFKALMKTANKKNSKNILNALYQWIDKLEMEQPTIAFFVSKYGKGELEQDLINILESINQKHASSLKLNTKKWKLARLLYLSNLKAKPNTISAYWINP